MNIDITESLIRSILKLIIIHKKKTKKITTVTLVWISDSVGSREGAQGAQAPLLFLDQTDEA